VVRFTPWLLYHWEKIPWYSLNRRLGGPQSLFEHVGEQKPLMPVPDVKIQIIQFIA